MNHYLVSMTKKITLLIASAMLSASAAFAGGVLTNTNQSARFARLMALDATTTIDGAYYNPAGLAKLGKDGFHFSFSNQSAFQERIITTTFAPFAMNGGDATKRYVGKASAPIIPSLQAAYKKGNWVLSGSIAVTGGGGKATFNDGLASFEGMMSVTPMIVQSAVQSKIDALVEANQIPAGYASLQGTGYSLDQYMSGSSYIYGAQIGGTYAINDMFSVYGGFRLNIVNNKYEGYLRDLKISVATKNMDKILGMPDGVHSINPNEILEAAAQASDPETAASLGLLQLATTEGGARVNTKQSGWGISPILGFNFNYKKLNIGVKYEFKTNLNVENKTSDNTGIFKHGVNVAHDIPALLTIGASYEVLPKLTLNAGYHRFFDTDADMSDAKNRYITGTNEYLFGAEYKINDIFLVSAGGQVTRYDLEEKFQSDLSFSLNSYSIGFGGAAKVAKNVLINVGYFWTDYSDQTIGKDNYLGNPKFPIEGKTVYSRTNKVFAAGVEFSF